jgi:hypothetical protein
MSQVRRVRFREHRFFEGILDRKQDTPAYRGIPEYLAFRSFNSGGYFGLALARYALDIYLTDEELQNPLLAVCERLALGGWVHCAQEDISADSAPQRQS